MEKDFFEEIEQSLTENKVDFSDFDELEEMVTPFCDGGGCSCTGGANCK
jgi:hypothetical protein